MRARMKKRQQMRRLTILVTVLIIAVSLGVGIYFLATSSGGSQWDKLNGTPVTSSDMAALVKVSGQPYGPAAPSSMQSALQKYSGTPFVSAGKPTVVYIGGEYCPYCAVERWALIMALLRFGNFTNLHYTASAPNDVGVGDYATLTFVGSSYSSQYISFRPYEAFDRSGGALQTVPSNYSSVWTGHGGGIPFVDFGNAYLAASSIIADPTILAGKNQTAIIADITTSDSTGLQIREGANLITAVICKLTQGSPTSVCTASPINSQVSSIAGPVSSTFAIRSSRVSPSVVPAICRPSSRQCG